MSKYYIYEGNLEALNKKLQNIQKKCSKYNCHFHYEELGEEYRDVKDDDGFEFTARFILVDVEGVAVCEEGWRVVGVIDHKTEMNVINLIDGSFSEKIPEHFYYSDPVCEHCNTKRRRKTTILIYHKERKEFRQVGKQCLKEYTGGLDADMVSYMYQYIQSAEEFESHPVFDYRIMNYPVDTVVAYAAYDVKCRGYISSYSEDDKSTREEVYDNLTSTLFHIPDTCKDEIDQEAEDALEYIRNLDVSDMDEYMHNLKACASGQYIETKYLGILVSLIPTYHRYLRDKAYQERIKKEAEMSTSEYVGQLGDKADVDVEICYKVSEWPGEWGATYLYKILDTDGNVYMWYSSRYFGDNPEWKKIKGTIKSHQEYRGIKQTILTRCKVVA